MRTKKSEKRLVRMTALGMVLLLFMLMAMGSGSSSSSGSSDNRGETAKQESEAETLQTGSSSENTENEADVDGAGGSAGETVNENAQDQAQAAEQEAWEVGEGKVTTYTDSIGSTRVQIAVPVVNTGSVNLYLSPGTMDLEDAEGHLVDSKSLVSVYPEIIKPGETAWYYEETSLNEAPSSELTVVPRVSVKKAKVNCIRYKTSDVAFLDRDYGGIKVTGRVENTTDEEGSMIYVVIMMYDEEENFIGQIYTILTEKLAPGDKIGFSATGLGSNDAIKVENIAQYRIYAYPLQYQF